MRDHGRLSSVRPVTDPDELYEDGLDPSLIRWMLSLTPTQRLQVLQDFVDTVHRAQESIRKVPAEDDS